MSDAVMRVTSLTRSYGAVVALNDITLEIGKGVVGLLGPNGAGKSTLLRILTGELRPTLGSVSVLDHAPFANPDLYHRIGICPEQDALFEDLDAREFLGFMLKLRGWPPAEGRRRAEDWLIRMGLEQAMDRPIRGFSKGMRQRVKLGVAMAHDPEVVFLDEPLTGLDPLWRHRICRIVRDVGARGGTVLFSSHVLHEVEQVTREVVLLNRGRVAAQGNAHEIRAMIDRYPHRVLVEAERPRELAVRLIGWDCVESVHLREAGLDLTTPEPAEFYRRVTEDAAAEDLGVLGLQSPDDSLQALFDTLVSTRPTHNVTGLGARTRARRDRLARMNSDE